MELFEERHAGTRVRRRPRADHHRRPPATAPVVTDTSDPTPPSPTRIRGIAAARRWLAVADGAVTLGVWTAAVALSGAATPDTSVAAWALAAIGPAVVALGLLGHGRRAASPLDGTSLGAKAVVIAAAGSGLTAAALGPALETGPELGGAAIAALVLTVVLAAVAAVSRAQARRQTRAGRWRRPVLLVAGPSGAARFREFVAGHPQSGYHVERVVEPGNAESPGTTRLRDFADADRIVAQTSGCEVLVALDDPPTLASRYLVDRFLDRGTPVHGWSPLLGRANRLAATSMGTAARLEMTVRRTSRWRLAVKRAIDATAALVLLVAASPVLAWAAWRVHREDGGPCLFRQRRVGRHGRTFELLKLRTMVVGAEAMLVDLTFDNERAGGPLFKLADDPRRTRTGRTLERLSIDELPQLWNVVRGDMSLVGPRPALPHEVDTFDPELLRRHAVTPGITGLWQLTARDDPSFDRYRELDLEYIEQWSLAMDLRIFLLTLVSVARRSVRGHRPAATPDEPAIDVTAEAVLDLTAEPT